MLNLIKPDEPVQIKYLNQPQDNSSISNEESKDVETFSKELEKIGLKFDDACKNKIDEDEQELSKTEKAMNDRQRIIEKMGDDKDMDDVFKVVKLKYETTIAAFIDMKEKILQIKT